MKDVCRHVFYGRKSYIDGSVCSPKIPKIPQDANGRTRNLFKIEQSSLEMANIFGGIVVKKRIHLIEPHFCFDRRIRGFSGTKNGDSFNNLEAVANSILSSDT